MIDSVVYADSEEETVAACSEKCSSVAVVPPLSTYCKLAIIPLSLTAIGVSAFLAWSAIKVGSVAGCAANSVFDCEHVLHSRWSKLFGMPVSIPAMGVHLTLLTAIAVSFMGKTRRVRQTSERAVFFCACCAALAAIWFVGLQVLVIGKLCKYCLVAHAAGLLAFGIVVTELRFGHRSIPWRPAALAVGVTLAFALGQVLGPEVSTAVVETHSLATDAGQDIEAIDMDFEPMEAPANSNPDTISQSNDDSSNVLATATSAASTAELGNEVEQPFIATSTPEPAKDSEPKAKQTVFPGPAVEESVEFPELEPVPTPTPVPDEADGEPQTTVAATPVQSTPRTVTCPGAKTQLKVNQWPLIGLENARIVIVQLFDYSCSHCRQMNRDLTVARQQFGDDLAIIALPVPLNSNCNSTVLQTTAEHRDACELSNLALAVWRVDKSAFPGFHDWLCSVEPGRTALDARLEAERRVDPERLRGELAGTVIGQYIARHIDIYRRSGEGTLPKLFSETMTISGQMNSATALCDTIRAHHGGAAQ